MSARTGIPPEVAAVQIAAQLRALDARLKRWRQVTAMRWTNKHVPPSAPPNQIIDRAVDEIQNILDDIQEVTYDHSRSAG